ncbi:MAG: hypothetical protein JSW30_04360 [Dehalococcoidia bacterium]|nr:MAG: hypothetical protein JSW30_04360 [Dehalococcoidia bacterium]
MNRDKELANILNDCLERLLRGETIEQCLQDYPQYAGEIEPLLQTAMAAKKALAIQPGVEFKARARYQFQSMLKEAKPRRGLPVLSWQPRWAPALAIGLAFLLAGSGTVAAAGNSMPDSPLYPVKLATEQAQLGLTFSDIGKAKLYVELADKRVAEIAYMVNQGKPEEIEATVQRLNNHLSMVVSLSLVEGAAAGEPPAAEAAPRLMPAPAAGVAEAPTPQPVEAPAPQLAETPAAEPAPEEAAKELPEQAEAKAKLKELLKQNKNIHPAVLRALLDEVPDSAKPALLQAIADAEDNYQKALDALDEEDDDDEGKKHHGDDDEDDEEDD